jgi:hypothetical protein
MSHSLHVCGIKPPNATWKKMKKVWDACEEAGIGIPDNVMDFFNSETPDEKGVIVDQDDLGEAVVDHNAEMVSGYDVDLAELDKDIKILRFYVSY